MKSLFRRRQIPAAVAVLLAVGAMPGPAAAWGPQGRKSIAVAATNLVRHSFASAEISYEGDIVRGAGDGVGALGDKVPLGTEDQAIDAVGMEIVILREAIRNGPGSYAGYRFGALSALVSELLVPYGMVFDEDQRELAERVTRDFESRTDDFAVSPPKATFEFIMNNRLYFQERRTFVEADEILIADDYTRGSGPKGMLTQAGRKYFERSISAVADVWYTVLKVNADVSHVQPSKRQMAQYYVNEIKYLLAVKKNFTFAQHSYANFERYNPGLPMALVEIGDAFYAFGTPESKARGVEEWVKAYGIPGASRTAASGRISKHYIAEGQTLYDRAQTPEGQDTDLNDALKSFTTALQFDLANTVAASSVTETTKAIGDRKDRYEAQQKYFDTIANTVKKAERSASEKDYAAALSSYNQALNVLPLVTPDFKDLHAKAREETSKITQAVKQVISDVYASANESIDKGDAALINGNVDDAVRAYNAVQGIVDVIPAEEGSLNAEKKKDMILAAQNKIDEAEIQRKRLAAKPAPGAAGAAKPGANPPPPKR